MIARALLGLSFLLLSAERAAAIQAPREFRGVWIRAGDRELLTSSRAKIAEAMELLADTGANVIFPPAWMDGATIFPSTTLKDALGVEPIERDVLAEILFEAHRFGLEVVPWFEPGIACPEGAESAILKRRPELFARDKDGKLILDRGVAGVSTDTGPGQDLVHAVVLEVCKNYDVDGVVGIEPFAKLKKEIAAVDAALVVAAPAATIEPGVEGVTVLPVADPPETEGEAEAGGDRLISYSRLRQKDGELAQTLRDGPWVEFALVPWRGGRAWRQRSLILVPVAAAGNWTWATREGEPQFLVMDGGHEGHVTWNFTPEVGGVYSLYVWIPVRDDQPKSANFHLSSAGGSRTASIDTSQARNRGWVRLGDLRLDAKEESELARLDAEEKDATRITAAGPMLPLLNRRAMRR